MTNRTNWTDFSIEERKYIKKRDNNKCVVCGSSNGLQIMHIFVSRSHGGIGNRKNGCLGCIKCHQIIDNPIGTTQNKLSKEYIKKCKIYLIAKENIEVNQKFLSNLVYKKEKYTKTIKKKSKEKCKNCKMLIKKKNSNSSMPYYYCVYKKTNMSRTNEPCKEYTSTILK